MGLFDAVGDLTSTLFTNNSNRKLTEQQWERDDNAVQRHTADMRAAGLNPILAAGGQAQSSSPIPMKGMNFTDTVGGSARAWSAIQEAKTAKKQRQLDVDAKEKTNAILDTTIGLKNAERDLANINAVIRSGDEWAIRNSGEMNHTTEAAWNASKAQQLFANASKLRKFLEDSGLPDKIKGPIIDLLGGF